MFSRSTRLRIQGILKRIAAGKDISLQERVFVDKFADQNQTVATWLKRARRLQQKTKAKNGIDLLLNGLDLGSPDPNSNYTQKMILGNGLVEHPHG